jgi:hypothetical protein
VIVIAFQLPVAVALDVRRVAGTPVRLAVPVADHVGRQATEWIAAAGGRRIAGLFGLAGLLPLVFLLPKQRADSRGLLPLLWQIVLQIGAVCSFVTRRRFLLSAAVPALALAGAALAGLGARWRRTLLALLAAIGLILGWKGVTDADRVAEREVGEYLGPLLPQDDQIAGDRTRVMWFAGRRPLWPRHYTDDELLAMAAPPEVRFVVLSAGTKRRERDQFDALEAGLRQHFDRLVLPAGLEASARERGLAVFVRR